MKTPIAVDDIRRGDLIRWEFDGSEEAGEYRAQSDGDRRTKHANYFLLDRRGPILPCEYSLGWVEFYGGEHWLGIVCQNLDDLSTFSGATQNGYKSDAWRVRSVSAYMPATPVPTEALEDLCKALQRHNEEDTYDLADSCVNVVTRFVMAVNEANA